MRTIEQFLFTLRKDFWYLEPKEGCYNLDYGSSYHFDFTAVMPHVHALWYNRELIEKVRNEIGGEVVVIGVRNMEQG